MNRLVTLKCAVALALGTTIGLLSLPSVLAQAPLTTTAPAQVILVTNLHACTLTKHPTLPLLYLTCNVAPECKNLITVRLNADGSLVNGGQTRWPDYFTSNPTNGDFAYYIPRPVVVADEKLLYLCSWSHNPTVYYAATNNNCVAVVSLDDQGQPAKLLKSFRTSHTEQGVVALGWEPVSRRLFLSYNTYFGWCEMGKDGLPVSGQFQLLTYPGNFWNYIYVPEWERFYGFHGNAGFCVVKMSPGAASYEFIQYAVSGNGSLGNIVLNRKALKLYLLDCPNNERIQILQLTGDGRLTGVPRYFPLAGATSFIRFDFRAGLLYAVRDTGELKMYRLNPEGKPTGPPQISQLPCNGVRDAVVDETTGKLYVLCTLPTTPAK